MSKSLLAALAIACIGPLAICSADAQDISGRWIYTENTPDMLTSNISELQNGIFRWTLLAKSLRTGQANQTTCLGRYRYDGGAVTTQWDPSCQVCGGDVCAPIPARQLVGDGSCAIRWQDANTFVNCQGQTNHRY